MVFPRAVLDKTVGPTVSSAVRGSFRCFFCLFVFFYPDVGIGGSVLQPALGSMAGIGKLLLGTCVLLFFFFLPFTRLEARPAPELIGL